jgi:hypothetical protein
MERKIDFTEARVMTDHIPPAKYTKGEYRVEIVVAQAEDGHASYQPMMEGKPIMQIVHCCYPQPDEPVPPGRSIEEARRSYRSALFCKWDHERIRALGGISDTVRYNARQDVWEEMQTFHESIVLPKGPHQKLKRALTARQKAALAARLSVEQTREAAAVMAETLGMSYADIGRMLGISKMRVSQLLA